MADHVVSMIRFTDQVPEPVKSFITFEILSQISCDKVQKNPHIFLHKTVSKFFLDLL